MSKTIQLRNVPAALHRRLKARAARLGMTLSGYLLREFKEIAERPILAEFPDGRYTRRRPKVALDALRIFRKEDESR